MLPNPFVLLGVRPILIALFKTCVHQLSVFSMVVEIQNFYRLVSEQNSCLITVMTF